MATVIGVLVLLVATLSDVKAEEDYLEHHVDFTFILHSRYNLLLTVHGSGCYFSEVHQDALRELADVTFGRIVYHSYIMGVVTKGSAIPATLTDMRDVFGDRLADFECLNKDVFYIPSKPATTTTTRSTPTTTTTSRPCVDNVGHGLRCDMVQGICNDLYANFICRRHCGLCAPTPGTTDIPDHNPVLPGTCADHLLGDAACHFLPFNVCTDSLAALFCPKHCHMCQTTTTTTTTTPRPTTTTTTPLPTTTSTAALPGLECIDHLVHGMKCEHVHNVCNSVYGRLTCRHFCKTCTSSVPQPTTHGDVTASSGSCVDYVGYGVTCQQLPEVCADHTHIGHALCPRFCGVCKDTTVTTPTTTTEASLLPCNDSLIYDFSCGLVPHVCSDRYNFICRRYCGLCHTTEPIAHHNYRPPAELGSCYDRVGQGITCQQLPGFCVDTLARLLCPRHCGYCHDATTSITTTTTTTTTKPHVEICKDDVGREICSLPGFCQDLYAQSLCRKTCGFCTTDCHDSIDCQSLIGPHAQYSHATQLCADKLRADVCEKTCGCPDYS